MAVVCRRCQTVNPASAVYCSRCGALLVRRPSAAKKGTPWYLPFAAAVVLLVSIYLLYTAFLKSKPTKPAEVATADQPATQTVQSSENLAQLVVGEIVVQDFRGVEILKSPAAVSGGGWVACPVWALFGGESLSFQSSGSDRARIERGFWSVGAPVSLWKIGAGKELARFQLSPWEQSSSVGWLSLRLSSTPLQVEIAFPNRQGSFISFPLPEQAKGPGVLLQEDRIVGWTFAEPAGRGYLWAGPEERTLTPGILVKEFYSSAVSRSREAHFRRVLAMGQGTPAAERLRALAYGFSLAPLLGSEDLPFPLKPQSVIMQMHSLASQLLQQGSAEEVARVLDERFLAQAVDPTLIKDAALALEQFQGHGRAIQFLETLKKNSSVSKGQTPLEIDQVRVQVYKDWLRRIIDGGSYSNGTVVFEEAKRAFPNDAELQLLGVEAALMERNWDKASELLQARDYPSALEDWVEKLTIRINERVEETDVNLRFNPREQIIPVEAYVNGSVLQKFIIDTGATTSSIPNSALEALGIKVDETTPVRAVQSIAEVAFAYEVTLDTVELTGCRVNGLKALVIDLPGYKDYGLLGLNFLDNFRVEIDKNKGVLRLKKR